MRSRRAALGVLLLAAACGKDVQQAPAPPAPLVPAPVLAPLLPDLEALAKLAEAPADLREVRELFDLAFVPGAADERLATRSRKSLLEHPQARWALEEGMLHADAAVRADGTTTEWERLYRFRQPYRDEPGEDTQLPAGKSTTVRATAPADAVVAEARLWYRLTPFVADDDPKSTLLEERRLELK